MQACTSTARHVVSLALCLAVAAPAMAAPGGWGGRGWGGSDWNRPGRWNDDRPTLRDRRSTRDDREGKVEVSRFVAEGEAAQALGHGVAVVTSQAPAGADVDRPFDQRGQQTFEAAVVDRLASVGYDTASRADAAPPTASVQAVELSITRDVVRPEEEKRSPVSGEMTAGVSNRGSMMGMALAVDLTKPRKALVSTRLSARIRDRATDAVLWEGRADIVTRDGDERWSDQAIAERLAGALFDGFPRAGGGAVSLR